MNEAPGVLPPACLLLYPITPHTLPCKPSACCGRSPPATLNRPLALLYLSTEQHL